MSLENQQTQLIRLCLEQDYLRFFKKIHGFREAVAQYCGESFLREIDLRGVEYQAAAIEELLLNDVKTNISRVTDSYEEITTVHKMYRLEFPYRFESKFQEYIRFLGYLLYKTNPSNTVRDLIREEYSILMCSAKRERLLETLSILDVEVQKRHTTPVYIINPTCVLLKTENNDDLSAKCFFFAGTEFKISIAEITLPLYDFLERNLASSLKAEEFIAEVAELENSVSKEELISSGIVLELPGTLSP